MSRFGTRSLVTTAVVALVSSVIAAAPVGAQELCGGLTPTITSNAALIQGTQGDDVILGGDGPNRIEAYGGNDTICSRAGDDEIIAGDGDDFVRAGGGVDIVFGGSGDDRMFGGWGADTCWIAEKVIELPDLNSMKADGQVDEADAGRLLERQKVTLRLDAHPDVKFEGKIGSIWRTVQRESWRNPLKVVRLEIELLETDTQRMRPGMRFRGKVETERVESALLVPVEAIFLTEDGPVVYRRTTFGYEGVAVELGRRNESRVEVLTGLSEGDSIALEAPETGGRA